MAINTGSSRELPFSPTQKFWCDCAQRKTAELYYQVTSETVFTLFYGNKFFTSDDAGLTSGQIFFSYPDKQCSLKLEEPRLPPPPMVGGWVVVMMEDSFELMSWMVATTAWLMGTLQMLLIRARLRLNMTWNYQNKGDAYMSYSKRASWPSFGTTKLYTCW